MSRLNARRTSTKFHQAIVAAEALKARRRLASIPVTSNVDSGADTRRAAITQANGMAAADSININLPPGSTISLLTACSGSSAAASTYRLGARATSEHSCDPTRHRISR